jgi:hypothetical protein
MYHQNIISHSTLLDSFELVMNNADKKPFIESTTIDLLRRRDKNELLRMESH